MADARCYHALSVRTKLCETESGSEKLHTSWAFVPDKPAAGSVTTLKRGAPVGVLSGSSYGLDYPAAVSSDGTNVWVPNLDQPLTGFPTSE